MRTRFRMIRDDAGHLFATPGIWPTGIPLPCTACAGAVRVLVETLAAVALDEDLAALARDEATGHPG